MNSLDQFTTYKRNRLAIYLMFLLCGFVTASWAPMVPLVKARLSISDSVLGTIMLALGFGAMFSMPIAGILINKIGSGKLMFISALLVSIVTPAISSSPSPITTGLSLFLFGAFLGGIDIAMNTQAVAVENAGGKPVMSGFHAMYSVGGLLGAGIISFLLGREINPKYCAFAVSATLLISVIILKPRFLPRNFDISGGSHKFTFPPPRLLVLGIFCFIVFLAEGAMLDWSAVLLKSQHGFSAATAGLAFACFSVAMAIGRFTGNFLNEKVGKVKLLQIGSLVCTTGYFCLTELPNSTYFPASLIGSALIGLGASNVVPIIFSSAGLVSSLPPGMAIASVATFGYTGLLVGPAFIGYIADHTSLPAALCGVGLLMLPIAIFGKAAIKTKGSES